MLGLIGSKGGEVRAGLEPAFQDEKSPVLTN